MISNAFFFECLLNFLCATLDFGYNYLRFKIECLLFTWFIVPLGVRSFSYVKMMVNEWIHDHILLFSEAPDTVYFQNVMYKSRQVINLVFESCTIFWNCTALVNRFKFSLFWKCYLTLKTHIQIISEWIAIILFSGLGDCKDRIGN